MNFDSIKKSTDTPTKKVIYLAVKVNGETVTHRDVTHLQIKLRYVLGGETLAGNHWQDIQRGYYAEITPVNIQNINGAEFVNYTGNGMMKKLVKAVSRKSEHGMREAVQIAGEIIPDMVDKICKQCNFELTDESKAMLE